MQSYLLTPSNTELSALSI